MFFLGSSHFFLLARSGRLAPREVEQSSVYSGFLKKYGSETKNCSRVLETQAGIKLPLLC